MPKKEKDYVLIKVKIPSKKGKKKDFIYYYHLKGEVRGKRHSTGLDIEYKARAFVEKIITEKEALQQKKVNNEKNKARTAFPTFYDFAKDFFDKESCFYLQWLKDNKNGRQLSPLYISNQRRLVKNYILNAGFVNNSWDNIQGIDILDFISQLQLSEKQSIRNEGILYGFGVNADKAFRIKKVLSLIFNRAVYTDIIDKSPVKKDSCNIITEKKQRERDIFSIQEIQYIFSSEDFFDNHFWKTFFLTLATTGIRMGEIRALRWQNILFKDNAITITNAFKTRKNEITEENFALPKWNKTRTVIMPEIAKSNLEILKEKSEYIKQIDFVFCNSDGTPLKYDSCLCKFKKMLKKTKLLEKDQEAYEKGFISKVRIFEPHCFRHSYNTHLINSNISDNIIQKIVGHSGNAMTQNYLHIDNNLLKEFKNSNNFDVYFKNSDINKKIDDIVKQFESFSKNMQNYLVSKNNIDYLNEFEKSKIGISSILNKLKN